MQIKEKQEGVIGESITAGPANIKTFFIQLFALFVARCL